MRISGGFWRPGFVKGLTITVNPLDAHPSTVHISDNTLRIFMPPPAQAERAGRQLNVFNELQERRQRERVLAVRQRLRQTGRSSVHVCVCCVLRKRRSPSARAAFFKGGGEGEGVLILFFPAPGAEILPIVTRETGFRTPGDGLNCFCGG